MLKLIPFELNEKRILEALLFDYFKEIDASKIVVHGHAEKLNYPYLDQYWNDVNRQAMKITFNAFRKHFNRARFGQTRCALNKQMAVT